MISVEFSDLPDDARVKLSEEGERELWHRIDEFGGVRQVSDAFGYPASRIYNWRNKDVSLPVSFVRQVMGGNNSDGVILLKGPGTGEGIENPEFPLEVSEELLTRIDLSVVVNAEGTPFYMTDEGSLAERFQQLLSQIGEVQTRVYSRNGRFELRYSKFLHQLLEDLEFERDFAAAVDEEGAVQEGKLRFRGMEKEVEEFDGELYSREKRFELALERGESDMIAELMSEEATKVRKMVGN
jgi:hypothetical protein